MYRLALLILTSFAYCSILSIPAARGEGKAEAEPLLLIADFSGSMNEKVGTEPKIALAKRAISEFLDSYPAESPLGLMLYGHRRLKDCSDIELVTPLSAGSVKNLAAVRGKIRDLRAQGETPIAESLLESIPAFGGKPGRILLVTDGREECAGDVCKAAEKLAEAGIRLRVDVVGFGLNSAARESLSCLTKITGGKYYDASTEDALRQSIRRSGDEALGGGKLRVTVTEGGKIVHQFVTIKVLAAGKIVQTIDRSPGETHVKAGVYDVTASVGDSGESDPVQVTVVEGKVSQISIDVGTGTLVVALTKGLVPLQGRLSLELFKGDALVSASTENPAKFQVRAGLLSLKIRLSSLQTFEVSGLDVRAGERLDKSISVPYAELVLSVRNEKYAPGRGPYPYVQVNKDGRFLSALSDNPAKFQLLEGVYEVGLIENGVMQGNKQVTIKSGEDVSVELP